ncbi:MAG: class I SAM-dependent methyltransferase [Coriobacteriia bacterium]|nr:class I SAM-dependent methyltransferase [Coriobacteriia bacterium]
MTPEKEIHPAADYDEFVDWGRRLAREEPLFRAVFEEVGARNVLDIGCGSARHAIMFATWGLDVVGVDPDESMLAQADTNIGSQAERIAEAGGSVRTTRGGFGGLCDLGLAGFDALVCTGNALPHVEGHEGLRLALADFAKALRRDGALVLHLLNHSRLLMSRPRSIPPVVRDTTAGTKVFLRVIDYPMDGEHVDFDFLTLVRGHDGEWSLEHRRSVHAALPIDLLETELRSSGFDDVRVYGGHDMKALEVDTDESVIVVAKRV